MGVVYMFDDIADLKGYSKEEFNSVMSAVHEGCFIQDGVDIENVVIPNSKIQIHRQTKYFL